MIDDTDPAASSTADPSGPVEGANTPEQGLASLPGDQIADLVLPAWIDFLELAETVKLDAPSRLHGWRAREVLVHLGSWDDGIALSRMRAEARAAQSGQLSAAELNKPVSTETSNAAVFERHLDAPRSAVLDALEAATAEVEGFLRGPDLEVLGHQPVRTLLGPLPMATVLLAGAYELAVHAMDLRPAGAPAPSSRLLDAGLAALVDTTGALAARHRLHASLCALTPTGGWAFTANGQAWSTQRRADVDGPTLHGQAATLLDASAGRASVAAMLLRREVRTTHVPGLLRLAPLIEEVPGLPGGAALRAGVGQLEHVERLLRRLPRLPGLRR